MDGHDLLVEETVAMLAEEVILVVSVICGL